MGWYFGANNVYTHLGSITNVANDRLRLSSQCAAKDDGTRLLDLTYSYPAGADNGNVQQISNGRDATRTQNYDYDSLNRLAHAYSSGSSWGQTLSHDAWGNLTKSSYPGKTQYETSAGGADAQNRLSGVTHDASGNITNDGRHTYAHDAEGRVISVDGGATTYTYDGDGRRVKKCSSGCTTGTLYWFAATGLLAESDLSGNWKASNADFGSGPFARVDYPSGKAVYYLRNHIGSAAVVVDGSGNIVKESDYFPFGGEIAVSGSDPSRFLFTGKERDAESGLDFFEARHYGQAGRFMSADPLGVVSVSIDPQQLNRYAYARNNPLRFVDPTGLANKDAGEEIITVVGDRRNNSRIREEQQWAARQLNPSGNRGRAAGGGPGSSGSPIPYGTRVNVGYPPQEINFNGTTLTYRDGQGYRLDFPATSGVPGVTDTALRNRGPIPAGLYLMNPAEITQSSLLSTPLMSLGNFFGLADWGTFRVPLHPAGPTETFGRGGFFLHGGERPGSAGCIDIGGNDVLLFPWLRNAGAEVPVYVDYP